MSSIRRILQLGRRRVWACQPGMLCKSLSLTLASDTLFGVWSKVPPLPTGSLQGPLLQRAPRVRGIEPRARAGLPLTSTSGVHGPRPCEAFVSHLSSFWSPSCPLAEIHRGTWKQLLGGRCATQECLRCSDGSLRHQPLLGTAGYPTAPNSRNARSEDLCL